MASNTKPNNTSNNKCNDKSHNSNTSISQYADHIFEPFVPSWWGLMHEKGMEFPIHDELCYYVLYNKKFAVVDNQSQIWCINLNWNGVRHDRVLRETTPISMWIHCCIGIESKLVRIGFVPPRFFCKLRLKNYKCYFNLNDKVYHQYHLKGARSQHAPILSVIVEKDPIIYAGQITSEYDIRPKQRRKHRGTLIGGGWTDGMSLGTFDDGENIQRWDIDTEDILVDTARKAASCNNLFYLNNYCQELKAIYLDLEYESAFFAKPDRFEKYKNCELYGFDGALSFDLLQTLMINVFKRRMKRDIWEQDVVIHGTHELMQRFGEYIFEYVFDFGVKRFCIKIKCGLEYDEKYIIIVIGQDLIENVFKLNVFKKKTDDSQYEITSDVILKYHRMESRIFVNKFSYRKKNNDMIKTENDVNNNNDMDQEIDDDETMDED